MQNLTPLGVSKKLLACLHLSDGDFDPWEGSMHLRCDQGLFGIFEELMSIGQAKWRLGCSILTRINGP